MSEKIIEDFYKEHSKKKKKLKPTRCQLANKNCKHWDYMKQRCEKGQCAI